MIYKYQEDQGGLGVLRLDKITAYLLNALVFPPWI